MAEDSGAKLILCMLSIAVLPIWIKAFWGYHLFPPRVKTIGIDLGTTHSLVAFMDPLNFSVRVLKSVPSIVTFLPNGTRVVGNPQLLEEHPRHTIFEAKRFLGVSYEDYVGDEKLHNYPFEVTGLDSGQGVGFVVPSSSHKNTVYTPLDVGESIVTELHRRLVNYLGYKTMTKVVIAAPAEFTLKQKELTTNIFENAGLKVIGLLDEPTAAAMAYGLHDKTSMNHVIVYDWGGGTLDVALLWVQNGNIQLLATDGDRNLGGADLDSCFLESLAPHYLDTASGKQKCHHHVLRQKVEIAKEQLSSVNVTSISCGGRSKKISRNDFESGCKNVLERALVPLRKLLKDARLNASDVDAVVMVGGSTRVPSIRQKITELFDGIPPLTDIDPDTAVAIGAARASND